MPRDAHPGACPACSMPSKEAGAGSQAWQRTVLPAWEKPRQAAWRQHFSWASDAWKGRGGEGRALQVAQREMGSGPWREATALSLPTAELCRAPGRLPLLSLHDTARQVTTLQRRKLRPGEDRALAQGPRRQEPRQWSTENLSLRPEHSTWPKVPPIQGWCTEGSGYMGCRVQFHHV